MRKLEVGGVLVVGNKIVDVTPALLNNPRKLARLVRLADALWRQKQPSPRKNKPRRRARPSNVLRRIKVKNREGTAPSRTKVGRVRKALPAARSRDRIKWPSRLRGAYRAYRDHTIDTGVDPMGKGAWLRSKGYTRQSQALRATLDMQGADRLAAWWSTPTTENKTVAQAAKVLVEWHPDLKSYIGTAPGYKGLEEPGPTRAITEQNVRDAIEARLHAAVSRAVQKHLAKHQKAAVRDAAEAV